MKKVRTDVEIESKLQPVNNGVTQLPTFFYIQQTPMRYLKQVHQLRKSIKIWKWEETQI